MKTIKKKQSWEEHMEEWREEREGLIEKGMACDQCSMVRINGVFCHETNCVNSWRGKKICKWCGSSFYASKDFKDFCDDSCYESYYG